MTSTTRTSEQHSDALRRANGAMADRLFKGAAYGSGLLILGLLAAVAVFLLMRAWPVVAGPRDATQAVIASFTGGRFVSFVQYVGPLLFGSVLVAALALAIAFFVSIGIAIFISQYAPRRLAAGLNTVVDLLAASPSGGYGLWGARVRVPATYPFWDGTAQHLGWIPLFAGPAANPPRTVATVALVLAVMILPIITSMTRDVFMQAPRLHQEAARALGATKWETIKLAVLPFGRSGIISASMLGLGRALGETMAVLMILSPGFGYSFNLLEASKDQTIAANIAAQYAEANNLGVSVLIATGLVLFAITFGVNYAARRLTRKATS